jgi:prevent-host-death family protein
MEVNIHEVRAHLSQLLERVSFGEEITITRAGKAVARLVPAAQPAQRRRLGWAAGEFSVPDDFDAPLPAAIEEQFYR